MYEQNIKNAGRCLGERFSPGTWMQIRIFWLLCDVNAFVSKCYHVLVNLRDLVVDSPMAENSPTWLLAAPTTTTVDIFFVALGQFSPHYATESQESTQAAAEDSSTTCGDIGESGRTLLAQARQQKQR